MKTIYLVYLFVIIGLTAANVRSPNAVLKQDLGGSNWQFRSSGNTTYYKASVPGTVHLDLLSNGIIEDPYFRDNVNQVQWVENKTWEYQTQFDLPADLLQQDNIDLVFEGLDTHAVVTLNGETILKANNMFRTWVVSVKSLLNATQNVLDITFDSTVEFDAIRVEALDTIDLFLPSDFDSGRIFTRKAAYHFGWDWGPRLVTCGVWRPVYLRGWSNARLDNVQFVQKKIVETEADIDANLELVVDKNGTYGIKVMNSQTGEVYFNNDTVLQGSGNVTFTASFSIANPKLWWVRNFGEPYLYPITVQILDGDTVLDQQDLNLGIRTIELIQEDDDIGRSFYFKINGVRVFAKGGNYIPPDAFMPRVTSQDYEAIIKDAVDANYNFIRVWGGGNYEDDTFYDICDREGILLWHDMMFANGMYPGYAAAFLDNIREEIKDNVRRLRNHPSIALWCGNNEIQNGWDDWGYQDNKTKTQINMIYGWYQDIFNQIIPTVLADMDTSRPYWPTSPLYGYGHNESYVQGDNHYYAVWVLNASFENYTLYVGRFMSEYGIQGLLCMNSIKKFTTPEDLNLNSTVILAHEKGPSAYDHIGVYLDGYYKPIQGFENYVYTTQIMQKLGIQTAIEAHRCAKPRNMGTLMWQLNDNWPSFSWSARDYYGTWKAVHYMAKLRYQDVIVAITNKTDAQNQTHYGVQIVSEKLSDFQGNLSIAVKDLDGTIRLSTVISVQVPSDSSQQYYEILYTQIPNLDITKSFIEARIDYPFDEQYSSTISYFVRPKQLELQNPKISISVDLDQNTVTIQSDTLVMGTYLFVDEVDLHFDDNYFDLPPNEPKTVKALNVDLKTIPGFTNKLQVLHLYSTYSKDVRAPYIQIAPRNERMIYERFIQNILHIEGM